VDPRSAGQRAAAARGDVSGRVQDGWVNEDDAFRERLAAMSPAQVAALYDATADDWAALGITADVFTHNMAAKADYDAKVWPHQIVFETYLAMSDQKVRDAARVYDRGLDDLHGPAHQDRPVADVQDDAVALGNAFDAAIASSGDARLIEAKRRYDRAVIRASERFARRLH
jgi:hypothetical protein